MSDAEQFVTVNAQSHISNPMVGAVDARGRKGSLRSRTSNILSRSRSRGRGEEKRPGTAGRFSHSKSRSRTENEGPKRRLSCKRNRSTSNLEGTSTLADLPAPPLTRLDCTKVHEDPSMIGVALGSPSQLQPTYPRLPGQSSLTKMNVEGPSLSDDYFEDPANKSKGARWKKIGGLFRAKNALLEEQVPSPFHQLSRPYAFPAGTETPSSLRSRPSESGPREHDAKFLFDRILGSNGQLAPQKYAVDPLHQASTQRPSLHNSSPTSLRLLDVKIPNVQMERYSVMFGSLLDKQEPPSLLARRDKTLNKLVTSSDQKLGLSGEKPEATCNNKDNSYLMPQVNGSYPRRATSPTPSKSPSFSLFPQLPQAAERIVGPVPSDKQSTLQRSFTAPSRLSPMQESFELDEIHTPKPKAMKSDDKTVASRPQTASTTAESRRNSSTPSLQSHTSTRSSLNAELLQSIKSLGSLKRKQANSEVFPDYDLEVAPLKPRHGDEDGHSEDVQMENKARIPNRPDMHADTLAALERPRSIESRNRDVSSLKPSKSRIDQIMRGTPGIEPSFKAAMKIDETQVFPERSESNDDHKGLQKTAIAAALPTLPESGPSAAATATLRAAPLPGKEQQPAARLRSEEAPSLPGYTHAEVRSQGLQEPSGHHQPAARDDPASVYPPLSQPAYRTHPSSTEAQVAKDFFAGQPPHSSRIENRQFVQTTHTETPSRPFAGNLHHRPHPKADHFNSRSPPNVSNRSHPNHRLPPEKFVVPPRIAFNQMHPPHGQNYHSATSSLTEKEQDNIIDYYLENGDAKSSSRRPKSPRKLRKRLSDKSKKRLSPSNKTPSSLTSNPTSDLASNLTSNPTFNLTSNLTSNVTSDQTSEQTSVPQSSDGGPRSPIPISKYSANAVAAQKPLASPFITSNTHMEHYSEPHSPADSVHFSPAVRAAREKAAQLSKASSVEDPFLKQTDSNSRSTTKSSSHPRPAQVEFSLVGDAPNSAGRSVTKAETSFYSHSNESTPSLETSSEAQREGMFGSSSIKQTNEPSFPHRSSSRGASLSSLPSGAGGVQPRSMTSKAVPAQPIRSHSAGVVGSATRAPGIQGHLKAAKGEKVVEKHAGLVPTIVDPEMHGIAIGGFGHRRAGRSVNLVIESV